MSDHPMGEALT